MKIRDRLRLIKELERRNAERIKAAKDKRKTTVQPHEKEPEKKDDRKTLE